MLGGCWRPLAGALSEPGPHHARWLHSFARQDSQQSDLGTEGLGSARTPTVVGAGAGSETESSEDLLLTQKNYSEDSAKLSNSKTRKPVACGGPDRDGIGSHGKRTSITQNSWSAETMGPEEG